MKYLYKGMGLPGWGDLSGSVLLGWHEKVSFHLLGLQSLTLMHWLPYPIAHGGRGDRIHRSSDDRPKDCMIYATGNVQRNMSKRAMYDDSGIFEQAVL
jgi:hypothetical protein